MKRLLKQTQIIFATISNNPTVLRHNLASSPIFTKNGFKFLVEHNYASASLAYNKVLEKIRTEVIVFAHQDVYFPLGWAKRLLHAINTVQKIDPKWGVLGVWGITAQGNFVGRVWSSGLNRELVGTLSSDTQQVVSIDEIVIVLRKETGLLFDNKLPGYHLYGTDIVQTALNNGYGAYVFEGPVIHNSLPANKIDFQYNKAYSYMQKKWRKNLPIPTCIMPITRSGWPLTKRNLCLLARNALQRCLRKDDKSRIAPGIIARKLNYEK